MWKIVLCLKLILMLNMKLFCDYFKFYEFIILDIGINNGYFLWVIDLCVVCSILIEIKLIM